MMEWAPGFKLIHILSATVLFGTGLGTAFYMWRADRSRDVRVIAAVSREVVRADWWFTLPAVVIQPVTGIALASAYRLPLDTPWVLTSLVLYVLIGACWIPVVGIQMRVARLAGEAAASGTSLPGAHARLMRWWYGLGWCAFTAVLAIFWLMVVKP